MAASDMLYPFFVLPLQTVYTWLGYKRFLIGGQVGEILCKFANVAKDFSEAVSIQSLVLIAVERFIVVMYPQKASNFTPRLRTILVVVTWIVAAVFHLPHFYIYRLETRCNTLYCIADWIQITGYRVYHTIWFTLFIYIPLPLIAVLYTSLSLKLRRMKAPGNQVAGTQDIRRREQNKRITKMSICVVVAFGVCWLPYAIYVILLRFGMPKTLPAVYVVLHLAWSNSAINPLILFYFCGKFRQGFKDMFRCCLCFAQRSNVMDVPRNIELQEIGEDAPES